MTQTPNPAPNPVAPGIPIKLDRPRRLLFDLNALALIENETGLNVFKEETWQSMSASQVRAFLWAGLKADDPDLTLEQTGALIGMHNFNEVFGHIQTAAGQALPEQSEDPPKAQSESQQPG